MKRKSFLILAVFISAIAFLFTSCRASVEPPKAEDTAYVTFGNDGSRELSTEYGIKSYDELYWYYTAEKQDGFGKTGETEGQTQVPAKADGKGIGSEKVGPFSQGLWKFTLYAYTNARTGAATDNLVYKGESSVVNLKGGEVKAVPVTVSLQGETGYVNISQAYFEWANSSEAAGKVYVTIDLSSSSDTYPKKYLGPITRSSDKYTFGAGNIAFNDNKNIKEGYYTCTVSVFKENDVTTNESTSVKADATPLATQTFGLRVYGNATTYIKGNITEGLFAYAYFDVAQQDMKVFVPSATGITTVDNISVVPDESVITGVSKSTKVEFSEGSFASVESGAAVQLDVSVTPIEAANEKFGVSGTTTVGNTEKSVFAGISLNLNQTTSSGEIKDIESFNNNSDTTATVSTYISTGLNNVQVKYSGDPNETISSNYDSTTGLLTFTTSHFSDYYVLADCVALNVTKNVGYGSLTEAIAAAEDGQTVKLIKDIEISKNILTRKDITLDLAGKSIVPSETMTGNLIYVMSGKLVITDSVGNGKIDSTRNKTTYDVQGCIVLWPTVPIKSYLQIDSGILIGNEYAVSGNGTQHGTDILINGGSLEAVNGTSLYHPQNGTLIINNGTFKGKEAAIEIRSGNLIINGGVFTSTSTSFSCSPNGSGTTTSGAAIAVAQHTTKKDITVEINGGTFTGIKALNESNPQANDPKPHVSLSVTGGIFDGDVSIQDSTKFITGGKYSSDPSEYLVEGYVVGYRGDDKLYEITPVGPSINGDVWTVNPENAQYTLDGAYGSIDGKTIVFSKGSYDKLELGRATKYAGSGTEYYIGGISEVNKKTFNDFYAIKNNGSWSASAYYVRNINNLTLKAEEGADVSVKGLIASSGHYYGEVYDYVLDEAYTSGSAYYLSQKINNIVIEGLNFTSKVELATSSADTVIEGVTFRNCTFTTGGTASSNAQGLRYYNENNNGQVKNLTVESCTFNNCYQGVYTQKINGVTVKNSTFDTTGHNAIAVQSGGAVNHKNVVITDNTFRNIGDRIIRFGDVGADSQITIKNNTAINSGDGDGQVIKAQSLAEGVTYNISGNNWGEGKTVANDEFMDK